MPQGNCASWHLRQANRGFVSSFGVLKASICYASGDRRRHSRRSGEESIILRIPHSCTASRALTNYTTAQPWPRSKLEIVRPRVGTTWASRAGEQPGTWVPPLEAAAQGTCEFLRVAVGAQLNAHRW